MNAESRSDIFIPDQWIGKQLSYYRITLGNTDVLFVITISESGYNYPIGIYSCLEDEI